MVGNRRPAGRPRTRILNREVITDAARRIITSDGVPALTMTRLAQRLSVTPSALYNHATSKQEILRWIVDSIMGEVDASAFNNEPWREATRAWAASYRDVMVAHAELISSVATIEVTDSPRTVAMYEQVVSGLHRAGFPFEACLPFIAALESFIYGAAFNELAPADIFDPGDEGDVAPNFVAAVEASQRGRNLRDINDELFDIGFNAIVESTAKRLGVD